MAASASTKDKVGYYATPEAVNAPPMDITVKAGPAPVAPPVVPGATVGSPPPAASPSQPSVQTPMQAGTGYVNLSRVLGANLGAGSGLKRAADSKVDTEFKNRQNAQDSYSWARNSALGNSSLAGGLLDINSLDSKLVDPSKTEGLKRSMGGFDFESPFQWQSNSENMQQLKGLSNAKTAGRVLAADAGVTGQYAPQLSALDAAIYGNNAAPQLRGAAAAYSGEKDNAAASVANTNRETSRLRDSAKSTADANRKILTDAAAGYTKDSAQGMALAALLNDPNLKFGVAGPGPLDDEDKPIAMSMGSNNATSIGNGSNNTEQNHGEGSDQDPFKLKDRQIFLNGGR